MLGRGLDSKTCKKLRCSFPIHFHIEVAYPKVCSGPGIGRFYLKRPRHLKMIRFTLGQDLRTQIEKINKYINCCIPVVGCEGFFAVVTVSKCGPKFVPESIIIGPFLKSQPETVNSFVIVLHEDERANGRKSEEMTAPERC